MGFRFLKRFQIFPGLSINLSKTGFSFSFGITGAKLTIGKRGIRKTVGIPGTGMYYTTHDNWEKVRTKTKNNIVDAEIDE